MESQRSFLLIGLFLVSFLLYQQWQIDYNPVQSVPQTTESTNTSAAQANDSIPSSDSADLPASDSTPAVVKANSAELIKVHTDTLEVLIDTKGGDLVDATLLKHDKEHNSEDKFHLLKQYPTYHAQSGLIGRQGPDASTEGRPVYLSEKQEWIMEGNALVVPLTLTTAEGLTITKQFYFERNKHSIEVSYRVQNNSAQAAEVQPFYQLKQAVAGPESNMMMPTYRGTMFSTEEEAYEKYDFEDMADASLNKTTLGGWVGMIEHYFVSAWVPSQETQNAIYTRVLGNNETAIFGMKAPFQFIQPGKTD
jgi:YidC/Oxa1 family membrane protein insertase